MSTDDAGPLGVYYQCFFGANAHLGLTEDDSFAMDLGDVRCEFVASPR